MKFIIVISTLLACAVAVPSAVIAPIATIASPFSSQYHAQDGLGQYTYGYSNPLSAKSEARSFDGSVLGRYSYIDANGQIQSVEYTADDQGFRVAASNLPVAPLQEVYNLAAPLPVQDTPEVIEARAKHLVAIEEAKIRAGQEENRVEEGVSVDNPAARSAIAVKSGQNPIAITRSVPVAPLLPLAYRPALYANPAVAVRSFVSPAIAIRTTPLSTAFSYSYGINNLNNLYQYQPALYHYPAYSSYAAHLSTPQVIGHQILNTVGDAAIVENADLSKERTAEEKSSQ